VQRRSCSTPAEAQSGQPPPHGGGVNVYTDLPRQLPGKQFRTPTAAQIAKLLWTRLGQRFQTCQHLFICDQFSALATDLIRGFRPSSLSDRYLCSAIWSARRRSTPRLLSHRNVATLPGSAACSIHRDDPATTLRRLRRRWCGRDTGWANSSEDGEKCSDGPVSPANADALMRLSDNQYTATKVECRYRRRSGVGTGQQKGA
jgi:hypothetical protein